VAEMMMMGRDNAWLMNTFDEESNRAFKMILWQMEKGAYKNYLLLCVLIFLLELLFWAKGGREGGFIYMVGEAI
jgi:hypothetical protein